MIFYWNYRKRGVLCAKGFVSGGDGRLMLRGDDMRVFRFFGVMFGAKFFGLITKDAK